MAIVKRGRIFICLLCMFVMCTTTSVNAYTTDCSYGETTCNSKFGTSGKFIVKGNFYANVPTIRTCTVNTSGNAKLKYDSNGKGYSRVIVSNKVDVLVGGIGNCNINLEGPGVSFSGKSASYETDTANWDYAITSDIWRLYSYKETHTIIYKLRKNKKDKATVTMGSYFKWGW